ncbi:MAG: hypothetical protein ABIQ93_09630 [Saprospiraceae bacterium]
MAETLFNAIVEALEAICAATGLTYPQINILIYCGFIPASWFGIVYLRRRRWFWLLALHLLVPAVYYWGKKAVVRVSKEFYDVNIQALERLGESTGWGYIGISVVVGVVVPAFIYLVLFTLPKRWLLGYYALMMVGNLAWYIWVVQKFVPS